MVIRFCSEIMRDWAYLYSLVFSFNNRLNVGNDSDKASRQAVIKVRAKMSMKMQISLDIVGCEGF